MITLMSYDMCVRSRCGLCRICKSSRDAEGRIVCPLRSLSAEDYAEWLRRCLALMGLPTSVREAVDYNRIANPDDYPRLCNPDGSYMPMFPVFEVATRYETRLPTPEEIGEMLDERDKQA